MFFLKNVKMKRAYYFLIVLLIPCFCFISYAQNSTRVYVSKVEKKLFAPSLEISGTVEYPDLSHLSSEVSGIVEKVFFDEGDIVKKGQVLVQLNYEILNKEIDIAKAIYNSSLEESKLKKWEFERYDTLFSSGDIPLRDLKQRETEYLKSKYQMEKAASELALLEIKSEKKKIKAPFNGVILEKLTHTGNWLESGMPVAKLAANDHVDIVCHAPQSVREEIAKGDPAVIFIKNKSIPAKVFAVIPYGDINTRTFPVKIRVKNQNEFAAGMEVKVKLQTSKPRESYIIPRDAIVIKNDAYIIYIAENQKAKEIPVEVISYEGINAEVISNKLRDGMMVVTRGNQFLSNEQNIEIVK
jgi:membrane fusion protein (multidrug efflux system)